MNDDDGAPRTGLSLRAKRNLSIAFTIAVILLLLLGAEAAVRVRAILKYGSSAAYEDYYTVDEKLGLRVAKASYSSGRISTNRFGFRGPEIEMPKPPNTLRLAFLGASTTWCAEVSGNEYAWPHLVTSQLRAAFPQTRFDYINAGLPGYTIEAIVRNLEYRVAPLAPDVIVIYEAANNFSGEMRDLAVSRGIIREPRMPELSWLGHYSLLWYLLEKNLLVRSAQRSASSDVGRLSVDPASIGEGYRQIMLRLVRTAQQNARLVVVATFSTQLREDQTAAQQRQAAAAAFFFMPFITPKLVIDGIHRYNEIARDVARETGALLIENENHVPGDPLHYTDTYHFTDAGSRAMAERISDALLASPRFSELVSQAGPAGSPR